MSLGDIIRSRVLLNLKDKYEKIVWITSDSGKYLLTHDPLLIIDVVENLQNHYPLLQSKNTFVLNLEKSDSIINLLSENEINYFGLKKRDHSWHLRSHRSVEYSLQEWDKLNGPTWSQKLLRLVDDSINNFQFPSLPPLKSSHYQIGLNWRVGTKWKDKNLPLHFWEKMAHKLEQKYTISWQQGDTNLAEYLDWISACELIITHDSLGLHLAQTFNKKVVGLFGLTSPQEMDWSIGSSYLQFTPAKEYDDVKFIEEIEVEIEKCLKR